MLKFNNSILMIYLKVLRVVSLYFMDSEILGLLLIKTLLSMNVW